MQLLRRRVIGLLMHISELYDGVEYFHTLSNPGFEGIASDPLAAVPEPSAFRFIPAGLAGTGFLRRKKLINHIR
jgi:hypothetical protein